MIPIIDKFPNINTNLTFINNALIKYYNDLLNFVFSNPDHHIMKVIKTYCDLVLNDHIANYFRLNYLTINIPFSYTSDVDNVSNIANMFIPSYTDIISPSLHDHDTLHIDGFDDFFIRPCFTFYFKYTDSNIQNETTKSYKMITSVRSAIIFFISFIPKYSIFSPRNIISDFNSSCVYDISSSYICNVKLDE